jgi:hypothetical protein
LLGLFLISHQDRWRDADRLINIGCQQEPVNKSGTDETKSFANEQVLIGWRPIRLYKAERPA